MMTRRRRKRRGYAMVMVVLFLLLFLGLWGQAARQIGSLIRTEEARARRVHQDIDRLPATRALAHGLAALEKGFPPHSPYTVADGNLFAITYDRDADHADEWTVSVAPTVDNTLPLLDPSQFQADPP